MVLNALKIPAIPLVSPTQKSTPYFFGISTSYLHILTPPARMVHKTASAPFNAFLLSIVTSIFAGYFPSSIIFSTAIFENLSRSSSISIKDIVESLKSGKESISLTSPLVNPKLPAPIKAIFAIFLSFL